MVGDGCKAHCNLQEQVGIPRGMVWNYLWRVRGLTGDGRELAGVLSSTAHCVGVCQSLFRQIPHSYFSFGVCITRGNKEALLISPGITVQAPRFLGTLAIFGTILLHIGTTCHSIQKAMIQQEVEI